jgi:formate-dependent nitrite reductase membrane component NrfD
VHTGNAFTGRLIVEAKLQNVWGLNHAIWFFCMGVGSALYLNRLLFGIELGSLLGMSLADLLGMLLVAIGGLILIADLGRPLRFFRAFRNVGSSWISPGAIADFVFLFLGGLLVLPSLTLGGAQPLAGLPWTPGSGLERGMAWLAAAAAVLIIVYPGFVLSFSPSIPFWNTTLIPLQYVGFAFAAAAGLAYLFGSPGPNAAVVALVAALAALALTVAHVLNARYQRGAARLGADRLLRGSLAPHFVWGTLVLGLGVPIALLAYHVGVGPLGGTLAVAGALMVLGNFLSKYAVIKAGYYAPLF